LPLAWRLFMSILAAENFDCSPEMEQVRTGTARIAPAE
jgi:hypothetical protein